MQEEKKVMMISRMHRQYSLIPSEEISTFLRLLQYLFVLMPLQRNQSNLFKLITMFLHADISVHSVSVLQNG